jgi:hypothetical protein
VAVSEPHDLYGLPLEQFVPERTALARTLRNEGQREEAARVGKLPKPSIAAWAVNQLVRTQHRAISDLFDAGDTLQKAQTDLLSGRSDSNALRKAADQERVAVESLMERARGLLSTEGHELSQTTLDRVADTLHAAAVDEDIRSEVKEGCLQKELRHAGLGGAGAVVGTGTKAPGKRGAGARSGSTGQRQATVADRQRARRLEAARKAESQARRAAQRAERELKQVQERRDRAAAALREAEDELERARSHAEEAHHEYERAQQELDQI